MEPPEAPVNDNATPVEGVPDLVNLERNPLVVLQRCDLLALRCSSVEPASFVDVVDGLNVDAIVKGERDAPDVVARDHDLDLIARELTEDDFTCFASNHRLGIYKWFFDGLYLTSLRF